MIWYVFALHAIEFLLNICQTWMGDSSLPKVLYLYTGGTIAGGSDLGRTDTTRKLNLFCTPIKLIFVQNMDNSVGLVKKFLPKCQRSTTSVRLLLSASSQVTSWLVLTCLRNFTSDAGSTGTADSLALQMAKYVNYALCSESSTIDGAVFTHGKLGTRLLFSSFQLTAV